MSENGFEFIKYIIIFLCLGLWIVGGGAKLKQATFTGQGSSAGVTNTASVYNPQVHYQTIILQ